VDGGARCAALTPTTVEDGAGGGGTGGAAAADCPGRCGRRRQAVEQREGAELFLKRLRIDKQVGIPTKVNK
jgi:hypothetical protein